VSMSAVQGVIDFVVACSTTNISNLQAISGTIDGVQLQHGNFVLLVGQSSQAQNGLYEFGNNGLEKATITNFSTAVLVVSGTSNSGHFYYQKNGNAGNWQIVV
jgi:hypothetical protein